jgi:hypothetical protein
LGVSPLWHRIGFGVLAALAAAANMGSCSRAEVGPAPAEAPAMGKSTAAPSVADQSAPPPYDLPVRRPIAGFAGLQTRSRLVFRTEPDKPHILSATFMFPERVRLHMALEQGKSNDRVLVYRCGPRGYSVAAREAVSEELLGAELAQLLLQTELRRALFLWPDGIAWQGEGRERSAPIAGLGSLHALVDADGRPSAMHSLDTDAAAAESLRAIRWKTQGRRQFPAHFELWASDNLIWVEDVERVETALNYIDAFFLPPDRRGGGEDGPQGRANSIDVAAAFECRIELPEQAPPAWSECFAAAEKSRALWISRGLGLHSEDCLELDAKGSPRAIVLRSHEVAAEHAAAWTWREEEPAWWLELARPQDLDSARLARLRLLNPSETSPRFLLERAVDADKKHTFRLLALSGAR